MTPAVHMLLPQKEEEKQYKYTPNDDAEIEPEMRDDMVRGDAEAKRKR